MLDVLGCGGERKQVDNLSCACTADYGAVCVCVYTMQRPDDGESEEEDSEMRQRHSSLNYSCAVVNKSTFLTHTKVILVLLAGMGIDFDTKASINSAYWFHSL